MNKRKKKRVLIAEDDLLVSKMIQGLLEELGYSVAGTATSGRQAIEMTESVRPDVVLMDIKMPDLDGIEATREIIRRCPTPIVVLSAHETPEFLDEAIAAGVGAYLIKPPNAQDLERAVSIATARFNDIVSLQRQAAELEALHQASLKLTSRLDLQSVLEALLEQILKLIDAYDAHIFFFDGDRISFGAALWANGTQARPYAAPRPQGLTYAVARSGELIVIPDVNNHPLFENWQWGGAIAGIPLRVGEQVIGVMNVAFNEPRTFDSNELRLLQLLAAQASIAIHNARLFEQVQRHATELEQRVMERTRELTEANRQLQELDRLKTKFIADISHELRTPATNVRLYLQLLERGKLEKRDQYLAVIKEQTDQMVYLVENILDFSHLELDKTKIRFAPVDLNLIAEQAVTAYQSQAAAKGLQLIFIPDTDLSDVFAEAELLARMTSKLLDNAIRYTPSGHIKVSTGWDTEQGQAYLRIQDTGMGIEPEDLPYLFERFYRGHRIGGSNISGAGLGLSLVKEIVNLHGGNIQVESQVGKGSTFTIHLPLKENQA